MRAHLPLSVILAAVAWLSTGRVAADESRGYREVWPDDERPVRVKVAPRRRYLEILGIELGAGSSVSFGDDGVGGAYGIRLLAYERPGLYVNALHAILMDAGRYGAITLMTEAGLHRRLDADGRVFLQVGTGIGVGASWWDACPEPAFLYCQTGSPLVISPHARISAAAGRVATLGLSARLLATLPNKDEDFPGYGKLHYGVGLMIAVDFGLGIPLEP